MGKRPRDSTEGTLDAEEGKEEVQFEIFGGNQLSLI